MRLFHRGDDRLFGEDFQTALQPDADVLEMQVVGGADHEEIELFSIQHCFERGIGLANGDTVFLGVGQPGRLRVDIADDLEALVLRRKDPRQVAQAKTQTNDAYLHIPTYPRRMPSARLGPMVHCKPFSRLGSS